MDNLYPKVTVGDIMSRPLGVTDNYGALAKPTHGILHQPVVDDFGTFIGWTMRTSYGG